MTPRHESSSVTLATVAEAAGVSRMTVSNAFNRPDLVSGELRERVLAAAAELGYAGPNPVARTLSRGRTGSVGLVLDYALTDAFRDPPTIEFMTGVAAAAKRGPWGCRSCRGSRPGRRARPRRAGRRLRPVLRAGGRPTPGRRARPRGCRTWASTSSPIEGDARSTSTIAAAARSVAEHVTALGHRRVAIVLPNDSAGDHGTGRARRRLPPRRRRRASPAGAKASRPRASTGARSRSPARRARTARAGRAGRGGVARPPGPPDRDHRARRRARAGRDRRRRRARDRRSRRALRRGLRRHPRPPPPRSPRSASPTPARAARPSVLLLDPGAEASVLLPTELVIRASTAPAP